MYTNNPESSRKDLKSSNRGTKPDMQAHTSENSDPILQSKSREELNLAILEKMQAAAQDNLKKLNFVVALQTYEKCLDHYFESVNWNPDHPDFVEYFQKILKALNDHALKLLKDGRVEVAQLILEKCEQLTNGEKYGMFPVPRNITFNHLACCYRRLGMLDVAMECLNMALDFISANERTETAGITHVNISAVLSQMNNHQLALEHAKKAVFECSFEIINSDEQKLKSSPEYSKKVTMLAIAYHNLAVEEDYCGNVGNAKDAYFKAYEMLERNNGPDDPLAKKFKASFIDAKERFANEGMRRFKSPKSMRNSTKVNLNIKRPVSSHTRSSGILKRNTPTTASGKLFEQKLTSPAARIYLADNRIVFSNRQQNVPLFSQSQKAMTPRDSHYSQQNTMFKTMTEAPPLYSNSNAVRRPQTANPKAKLQSQESYERPPSFTQNKPKVNTFFNSNDDKRSESSEFIQGGNEEEIQEIEDLIGIESDRQEKDFNRNVKNNRIAFLQNLQNFSGSQKNADTKQTDKLLFSSQPYQDQNGKREGAYPKTSQRLESKGKGANENGHGASPSKQENQAPKLQNVQSPNKRSQRAATQIQKHVRGKLARKKYGKFLQEKRFWLLINSVTKLSLHPEDPFNTHNYQIIAWYDLLGELMIFQIKKLFNKKQAYTAKAKHTLPTEDEAKVFVSDIKSLAVSMIPLMYLDHDALKFKPSKLIFIARLIASLVTADIRGKNSKQSGLPSPREENTLNHEGGISKISVVSNGEGRAHDKDAEQKEKVLSSTHEESHKLSEEIIRRIQALIRGKQSRAKFVFLGKGMYQARDSLSFRYQGSNINIRILQKYPPRSQKLSPNPKEFLIYACDWTKCIEFEFLTVPATHFKGKQVKVENLREFLEINVATHKLRYISPKEQKPKKVSDNTLGLDEKTLGLILKVQKVMRGHLWRKKYNFFDMKYYRVVFSKSFLLEKHIINVRVLERIYKGDPPKPPERLITAQDFTDKARFGTLKYDYAIFRDSNPSKFSIQDITKVIEFDVKRHTMSFKSDKKAELIDMTSSQTIKAKKKQSTESHSEQHKEVASQDLGEELGKNKPKLNEAGDDEDDAARRIQRMFRKNCKNLVFLMKMPLRFSTGEEFEATIFYNSKLDQIWVDFRAPHHDLHNLRLSVHNLGLNKFVKGEFLDEIDFYLLGYLSFKHNHVVFEKGEAHVASTTKDDDPISISTKKENVQRNQIDYVVEVIDTDFGYEKEFEEDGEIVDNVLQEAGRGLNLIMRSSLQALSPLRKKELPKEEAVGAQLEDIDNDPEEIRAFRASFRGSLPHDSVILEKEKLKFLNLITSEALVEKTSNVLHITAVATENEKDGESVPIEELKDILDDMYERAIIQAEEALKRPQVEGLDQLLKESNGRAAVEAGKELKKMHSEIGQPASQIFEHQPEERTQENSHTKDKQENEKRVEGHESGKQEEHKEEIPQHEHLETKSSNEQSQENKTQEHHTEEPKSLPITQKEEVQNRTNPSENSPKENLNKIQEPRDTIEREGAILKQIEELESKAEEKKKEGDTKQLVATQESSPRRFKVEKAYQQVDPDQTEQKSETTHKKKQHKHKEEKKKALELLKEEVNENDQEDGTNEKKPKKKKKSKKKDEEHHHPEEEQKAETSQSPEKKELLVIPSANGTDTNSSKHPEVTTQSETSKLDDPEASLKKKKKKSKKKETDNTSKEDSKIEELQKKQEEGLVMPKERKKNDAHQVLNANNLEDSGDKSSLRSPLKTDRLESSGLENSQVTIPKKKKKSKKKDSEQGEGEKKVVEEQKIEEAGHLKNQETIQSNNESTEGIPKKKTKKKKIKQKDGESESLDVSRDSQASGGHSRKISDGQQLAAGETDNNEEIKEKKPKKKSKFAKKAAEDAPNEDKSTKITAKHSDLSNTGTQLEGQGSELPSNQQEKNDNKDVQKQEEGKEEKKKKKKKKKPVQESEPVEIVIKDQKPVETSESHTDKVVSPKPTIPKLVITFQDVQTGANSPSKINRETPTNQNTKPDQTPNANTEAEGESHNEKMPPNN